MRTYRGPRVDATILGTASLLALAMGGATEPGGATERFELVRPASATADDDLDAALAGLWVSADREVQLQLNTDGSYGSSVAGRKRAAQGTYRVAGPALHLRADTGLATVGTLSDGAVELAGHRLYPA